MCTPTATVTRITAGVGQRKGEEAGATAMGTRSGDVAKLVDELTTWLALAEQDLQVARDGLVIFCSLSFGHMALSLIALEPEESVQRDCPSVSVGALLIAIGLLYGATALVPPRSQPNRPTAAGAPTGAGRAASCGSGQEEHEILRLKKISVLSLS